jgi:Fe-S cluster assembly protein SufD
MTRNLQTSAHPPPSAAVRSFEAQWRTRTADPLSAVREQAMMRFLKLGLPTLQDETWRYTNLRSLAGHTFSDAPRKARGEIEPHASLSLLDANERAATLLMVNGYPLLPATDTVVNGIEVNTIREFSRLEPKLMQRYLEPLSDADQQRWALLNTALFVGCISRSPHRSPRRW